MKNLSLLSIATLLGLGFTSGCILDVGDDTGTSDDVDTTTTTDDATDDATTEATTTDDATTDATDDDVDTTDATDDATTDTTDDETTDGGGVCGWDPDGLYYDCGFEGADPSNTFPLDCPDGLVEGAPCADTGLTGEGCCDADGNNWYCAEGDIVFLNACGA